MSNILVTGGAGYIGSHACKALAAAGYTPISYDNLSRGHRWAVRWGPLEIGDIADRERLDAVLKRHQPTAVMHFAAYAYVGESMQDPGIYYRNNLSGTLTLLEAMRDHGLDLLVFSSTCAIYGVPNSIPIPETHPQKPINPYGKTKWMIEHMLRDFSQAHGLRWIALRYFNAAGADPDGETGELHEPEPHLIPLVLMTAQGKNPSVKVFGNDYPTPDGSCIRDYIHVADLASAHVRSLRFLEGGGESRAFNLGTGKGFSVLEVIEHARRVTGREISVQIAPRRPGDPAELYADAKLAQRLLNWQPEHVELSEILEHAWRWQTRQKKSGL